MSLRFAPARLAHRSPVARALARRAPAAAANDDGAAGADAMLRAALEHFAAHGLGAAQEASCRARRAAAAGDAPAFAHWQGVCRMLDRRLATELEAPLAGCPTGNGGRSA